jgi:hypothetical protein
MTKPTTNSKPDFKFDAEEQELLKAFEAGEMKPTSPPQSQLGKVQSGGECDVYQRQTH